MYLSTSTELRLFRVKTLDLREMDGERKQLDQSRHVASAPIGRCDAQIYPRREW